MWMYVHVNMCKIFKQFQLCNSQLFSRFYSLNLINYEQKIIYLNMINICNTELQANR